MVWITNARNLAIFGVVLVHVASKLPPNHDLGSWPWWVGNLYDSPLRWCVPVFVMISGVLMLGSEKKDEGIWVFYKKRLAKVMIPTIFWSLVYLVWAYSRGRGSSIEKMIWYIMVGRPYFHLWYLYMILGLYMVAPFARKVVANSTDRELYVLVIGTFSLAALHTFYEFTYPSDKIELSITMFAEYLPYFFMGGIIRRARLNPPKLLLFAGYVLAAGATLFGLYLGETKGFLRSGLYFYEGLSVTVIVMSICIFYIFRLCDRPIMGSRISNWVATLSMGIYLIHPLILDIVESFEFDVTATVPLLTVPLFAIFIFATSLAASWVLSLIPFLRRTI